MVAWGIERDQSAGEGVAPALLGGGRRRLQPGPNAPTLFIETGGTAGIQLSYDRAAYRVFSGILANKSRDAHCFATLRPNSPLLARTAHATMSAITPLSEG
jgi:hypothetical protein